MKALIDTNVIIDSLQSRKGFLEDAGQVMLRACDYDGYIAASSITDIFYLQGKFFGNKKKAKQNLADLLKIFKVLDTTAEDCKNALRSEMADFEDAILVESAMRSGINVIVTRNKKDFRNIALKVCNPDEFLALIEDYSA